MSKRSAEATIKGFLYQFDLTILKILKGARLASSVVVEGVEDIDQVFDDHVEYIQCKYYEGSSYNHSVIKQSVIAMLKHYKSVGCPNGSERLYRLYGHYKDGQDKLPSNFSLEFLKKYFLSGTRDGEPYEAYKEMSISDSQLKNFKKILKIDINAESYEEQQKSVVKSLKKAVPSASYEDIDDIIYPVAVKSIQAIAIKAEISKRRITKQAFISAINRKEIVFERWLQLKFGQDYYIKTLRKKYFTFSSTRVPKSVRIFAISFDKNIELSSITLLCSKLADRFSHKEHKNTPQSDRFCPYILLSGVTKKQLIQIKQNLVDQGTLLTDGFPFKDSKFSPQHLSIEPTSGHLIRIKFIPSVLELESVVKEVGKERVEVFDFYVRSPIDGKYIPSKIVHYPIAIESSQILMELF